MDEIVASGDIFPRAEIDQNRVAEFVVKMKESPFPPLTVYFDGQQYWLADGFHRYYAAEIIGRKKLQCLVAQGSCRDAILYALSASSSQSKRTSLDKRRAVEKMLFDQDWSKWSDRKIARQCGVSHTLVAQIRKETGPSSHKGRSLPTETRIVTRKGSNYSMKVSNIGQSQH